MAGTALFRLNTRTMNEKPQTYKYNYTFLYQSIAVYATTLALYLVVRGLLIEKEFTGVLRDPVVYLLCAIILFSSLAVLYNVAMKRRIVIEGEMIYLRGAMREMTIDRSNVRQVRVSVERERGLVSKRKIIKINLKNRRIPAVIRTYNFERNDDLYTAIKNWSGDLLMMRPKKRKVQQA